MPAQMLLRRTADWTKLSLRRTNMLGHGWLKDRNDGIFGYL